MENREILVQIDVSDGDVNGPEDIKQHIIRGELQDDIVLQGNGWLPGLILLEPLELDYESDESSDYLNRLVAEIICCDYNESQHYSGEIVFFPGESDNLNLVTIQWYIK